MKIIKEKTRYYWPDESKQQLGESAVKGMRSHRLHKGSFEYKSTFNQHHYLRLAYSVI